MKEKILELRAKGLKYTDIQFELKCSKSLISYYCSDTVKQTYKKYKKDHKGQTLISRKTSNFLTQKIRNASSQFSKRSKTKSSFGYKDVVNKFGKNTKCYLTGRDINLFESDYNFDHIIPLAKGGSNELDNLGITCPEANFAKGCLNIEDFFSLCKEVLEYNGYKVDKLNNASVTE